MKELETERLILREIKMEDHQRIYDLFSNEELTRYYGQDPLTSMAQAKQLIESFSTLQTEKRGMRWAIVSKVFNEVIGTIGFHNWNSRHKRAEIGYEIHPAYWRRGYAAEAVKTVNKYGFDELQLNRIGAIVFLNNDASNSLLRKLGFVQEGILHDYMMQGGNAYDTYVYSLRRNDAK
ncbi:GNAT family N-acetyltransferase [Bacillus weihaiensis]|uniref:GNAT family N-acetyltransferase n=1 Tax=Bacillus weihaiensis TaxID=1547283 RepID=UPI00235512B0|nr:GNAT family N-acetyltransferase [Bacillus weihaiensis]